MHKKGILNFSGTRPPAELTIVGGALSGAVAALSAARAGCRVEYWIPDKGPTGGFGGLEIDGRRVDLGARMLELNAFEGPAPAVAGYRPGDPVRPFLPHVRRFVQEIAQPEGLRSAGEALWCVGGVYCPDMISSLNLGPLRQVMPQATVEAIIQETRAIAGNSDPGLPVLRPGTMVDLSTISAGFATDTNHGPTLQRHLIEPWAEKLLPGRWREIPADLRHKIWLPLFWPGTIAASLSGGREQARPSLTYEHPAGDFGSWIRKLMICLQAENSLSIMRYRGLRSDPADPRQCILTSRQGADVPCTLGQNTVLAITPEEVCRLGEEGAASLLDTMPLGLSWFETPQTNVRREAAFISILDPGTPVTRVSFEGADIPEGRKVLTVEHGLPADTIPEDLEAWGVVDNARGLHHLKTLTARLVAPTMGNRERVMAAVRNLQAAGGTPVILGSARRLGQDLFNEHIAQGLAIAARVCATGDPSTPEDRMAA